MMLVIGSNSPKQLRKAMVVIKGGPLPREVVDALNRDGKSFVERSLFLASMFFFTK